MQQQMQAQMQAQAMAMQQQQQQQMMQMQQQMQQQQNQARQAAAQAQAAQQQQQAQQAPKAPPKGWAAKPEAAPASNLAQIMGEEQQLERQAGPDLARLQQEQQMRMDQLQREHVAQQQNFQRHAQGQMQQMAGQMQQQQQQQQQQRQGQGQQQQRQGQQQPRRIMQRGGRNQRPAPQVSAVDNKPKYTIKSGNPGMMTTREIESLIRQQHKSLMGEGNPYVDDYYHYATLCNKVLERLGGGNDGSALPGIVPGKGGVAASLARASGRTMPKHVANSLGKVAKWSADTPRELLKVPAPAVEGVETIKEGAEIEAPPVVETAPSPRSSTDAKFPLKVRSKIEAAWGYLYELEEFDRAEATGEDDPEREAERKVEAEKLLEALQLRGLGADATSLPSACSATTDILLPNPGDEYFVAMCRLPKGRRLLRRAIPLLVPEFAQPVFSTVFRNIGVLQCTDEATRTKEDDDFFVSSLSLCLSQ